MKYNISAIMSRAWEIRRAAAARYGCKVSAVLFADCLKAAWADVKNTPEAVIAEWSALSPEKQVSFLTASVKKAAKNEIGYSAEDRYLEYNETVAWFLHYHGLDSLTNEAFCKLMARLDPAYLSDLNDRRHDSGRGSISLATLVYYSAKSAISAVWRSDIKHGVASSRTYIDESGKEHEYIEEMARSRKPDAATTAILRVSLQDFMAGRDEIDNIIAAYKRDGFTEREIAAAVGISGPAVHKRIVKLREALRTAGIA